MGSLDLLVIGGGAAGLMAAITASERGKKVLLLEKGPKLGRKILISGGGRSNITNNKNYSLSQFLANYPRGNKFLWSAFSRFGPLELMNWFEQKGLKLKTESDGRVFPQSDKASDVLEVLLKSACNVDIQINCKVVDLCLSPLGAILQNDCLIQAQNLLIASGGMSYRQTGSTGDAYEWAIKAGHTINQPKPSLIGYLSPDDSIKEMAGLSLIEAGLKIFASDNLLAQEKGALLFTHWGVTGPGVFKISSLAANHKAKLSQELFLKINLFPNYKKSDLENKLKNSWLTHKKRKIINCLDEFVSERLAKYIVNKVFTNLNKTVSEISKNEFSFLVEHLMALKINLNGIRPSGEEIVTAGGIYLNEIEPQTMASKLIKGLYFAGEVIDVDGFTGGYNLQAAWSTGWLVGQNI